MIMKKYIHVAVLASIICLGISCASAPKQAAIEGPRFTEADSANVVLQFNSWDYIFFTHPEYRENGFLRQVKRADLGIALTRLGVKKNLAVVTLGWNYEPATLAKLVDEWKATLTGYGFQRVVCLRPGSGSELNGCVIIDDSSKSVDEQTHQAKL